MYKPRRYSITKVLKRRLNLFTFTHKGHRGYTNQNCFTSSRNENKFHFNILKYQEIADYETAISRLYLPSKPHKLIRRGLSFDMFSFSDLLARRSKDVFDFILVQVLVKYTYMVPQETNNALLAHLNSIHVAYKK